MRTTKPTPAHDPGIGRNLGPAVVRRFTPWGWSRAGRSGESSASRVLLPPAILARLTDVSLGEPDRIGCRRVSLSLIFGGGRS